MASMLENLRKIFENTEVDEARHARPVVPQDGETPEEEPEETFQDYIARKISNLQTTSEELKTAIEREQENIKNGHISSANGLYKINGWQTRLNSTQYKIRMLQTALDAYINDKSADNEAKLKLAAKKSL